ncbi:redox-sensing transcriptional repressor Rex [bacterium]|nr:redox-sensing transcriptional repressor Rex [bacterium]
MIKIPDETIGRLFPYLRALTCLSKEGTTVVLSSKLAEICKIKPSMIRKDLSYFGDFGKRGVGYNVADLKQEIKKILHIDKSQTIALVGVGNIGKALLSFPGFESEGFRIVMAFDNDPQKIGQSFHNIVVEDEKNLEQRIEAESIQCVIIAVPESIAVKISYRLAKSGVKSLLSFTPCQLKLPKGIKTSCIDLSTEIARLIYYSG